MTKLKTIAGRDQVVLREAPHKTIAEARFEADRTIAAITAELAAEKQRVARVEMEMAAVEAKLEAYMHMHASCSGHTSSLDEIESDEIQHKCARLQKLITLLECVFPYIVIQKTKHQLGMIPRFIKPRLSLVWIKYCLQ